MNSYIATMNTLEGLKPMHLTRFLAQRGAVAASAVPIEKPPDSLPRPFKAYCYVETQEPISPELKAALQELRVEMKDCDRGYIPPL